MLPPFSSISAIAIPIDSISFITPHGPLGLAQVTARPTMGAAATMVFHSSGVKSDLLAIELVSYFLVMINRVAALRKSKQSRFTPL
ncbi:MAG TPA: hypothetical protein VKR81_13500 [Candidatus Binatia bacterium]|nr:hypothetical protein [Candidatus Binatia bacterium]